MTDIRQTLETAFDGEPPLNLDLAAIRRAGRRRVALRRTATATAVLAAVTAVCVPAVLGSAGDGMRAGGRTSPAPPVWTTSAPPVRTTSPPSATPSLNVVVPAIPPLKAPPKPPTPARAAELTALLAGSGVLPDVKAEGVPGNPGGAWEFVVSQGGYKAVAEMVGERRGQVLVTLTARDFGCASPGGHGTCTVRWGTGTPIEVVEYQEGGTHAITVSAQVPDGTVLSATAVNSDSRAAPTGTRAPLTVEQLAKIATSPGFSF